MTSDAIQMSDSFQFNSEFRPATNHIRLRGVDIGDENDR